MRIFILEDNLERLSKFKSKFEGNELVIKTSAQEAIDYLKKDLKFDLICLDHDLGGEAFVDSEKDNTGYQVAKWLSSKNFKGEIVVHSWNPIGAENICNVLPNARRNPFIFL